MRSGWGCAVFLALGLALGLGACARPPAPSPGGSGSRPADTPQAKDYAFSLAERIGAQFVYPVDLRTQGTEGEVGLGLLLRRNGELVEARIVRSSDARLDGPTLEAARKAAPFPPVPAEFKPGSDRVWVSLPIAFRLQSPDEPNGTPVR